MPTVAQPHSQNTMGCVSVAELVKVAEPATVATLGRFETKTTRRPLGHTVGRLPRATTSHTVPTKNGHLEAVSGRVGFVSSGFCSETVSNRRGTAKLISFSITLCLCASLVGSVSVSLWSLCVHTVSRSGGNTHSHSHMHYGWGVFWSACAHTQSQCLRLCIHSHSHIATLSLCTHTATVVHILWGPSLCLGCLCVRTQNHSQSQLYATVRTQTHAQLHSHSPHCSCVRVQNVTDTQSRNHGITHLVKALSVVWL